MKDHLHYAVTAELWMYQGQGAWHFVTLPEEESKQIKFFATDRARAWGSVPVTATIGETSWRTSIFPDRKAGVYLLPVKADIRKKENIRAGDKITVQLDIAV